jgi:hypothetical protein
VSVGEHIDLPCEVLVILPEADETLGLVSLVAGVDLGLFGGEVCIEVSGVELVALMRGAV